MTIPVGSETPSRPLDSAAFSTAIERAPASDAAPDAPTTAPTRERSTESALADALVALVGLLEAVLEPTRPCESQPSAEPGPKVEVHGHRRHRGHAHDQASSAAHGESVVLEGEDHGRAFEQRYSHDRAFRHSVDATRALRTSDPEAFERRAEATRAAREQFEAARHGAGRRH